MRRFLAALGAGLLAFPLASRAAASPTEGARIAAICAACHRLDGRDVGTPPIIGRGPEQLVLIMKEFGNTGENHVMNAVVRSLSDAEIESVARYLGALRPSADRP